MGKDRYWIHSAPDGLGDEPQRPCARGGRCASRDSKGQPALGPRVLCSADRDFLLRSIEQLPEMYLELYMTLGDKSSGGSDGPRVSGGGKTPPIPVRADVDALMRRLIDVLSSWDERVRLVAKLAGPDTTEARRRRDGVAMTTICRTLTAHIDVLLALDTEPMMRDMDISGHQKLPGDAVGMVHTSAGWISYQTSLSGAEAALEIFTLHALCRSKLGYTRKHVMLRSRCWDCDASGKLVRYDGSAGLDDHVTCQACGTEYVGRRLVALMEDEDRITREIAAGKKAS